MLICSILLISQIAHIDSLLSVPLVKVNRIILIAHVVLTQVYFIDLLNNWFDPSGTLWHILKAIKNLTPF